MQKKIKETAKTKTNSNAKERVKSAAKKVIKGAVKKEIKDVRAGKVKKAVKRTTMLNPKKTEKNSAGDKAKKTLGSKTKNLHAQAQTPPFAAHGKDQHFIPAHGNQPPVTISKGNQKEQLFHQREEVAIHHEDQEVKANMANRMGRKRIFRIQGKR